MVLRVDVVEAALRARYGIDPVELREQRRVIALTPGGRLLDDALADELAARGGAHAAVRPLRGLRRADHRALLHRGGLDRPLRAGGRRARGDGGRATRCCASCRASLGHEDSAVEESFSAALDGAPGVPALHAPGRLARLDGAGRAALRPPRADPELAPASRAAGARRGSATIGRRFRGGSTPADAFLAMSTVIDSLERAQLRRVPRFQPGDRVQGPLPGRRGHPPPHPGLRGCRHQAPGRGRARDLHGPQAVLRRRRGAHVPACTRRRSRGSRSPPAATSGAPSSTTCAAASASARVCASAATPVAGGGRRGGPAARSRRRGGRCRGRRGPGRGRRRAGARRGPRPPPPRRRGGAEAEADAAEGEAAAEADADQASGLTVEEGASSASRLAARARPDRRGRARARARHPGLPRQAVPIPSESMVPTLQIGQRVLVNRIGARFGDPDVGDIVVFHPPTGAEEDDMCGEPAARRARSATSRRRSEADVNFIKRVVAGPGDRICDPQRPRDPQRQAPEGAVHPRRAAAARDATSHARSRFRPITTS